MFLSPSYKNASLCFRVTLCFCMHTCRSLVELQSCESQEALEQLAMTFTASRANFGALETVELERGRSPWRTRRSSLTSGTSGTSQVWQHGVDYFKEDLGWFSVLMLIGALFLPTTNLASQTHNQMPTFRLLGCSFLDDICPEEDCSQAVKMSVAI